MSHYDHRAIEPKWQKRWDDTQVFKAEDSSSEKEKLYLLVEFPYPSGKGLHVGHPRPYTALDVVARKRRFEGYNVLYPMGWDAFGLPTENYAIKNKIHPRVATDENISNFKKQLKSVGFSFDWSREIDTTDPAYYKWTQVIFLKFLEKGLAYKDSLAINWCPTCKIGLANEEVVSGGCERCGGEVVKREKEQWMLKITAYAEKLIKDLDLVDYISRAKIQQKNWIGRSEGAELHFHIADVDDTLEVFTTRPDTIYGATYMVIAPEHPYVQKYHDRIRNIDEVHAYQEMASKKSDFERTELVKEKTGVRLDGLEAINPVSGKRIPIWISDYVMMGYGTGAIMAVPAHDTRDYEFATKFGMEIIEVISGGEIEKEAYTGNGELINSDIINGLSVDEAKKKIIAYLEEKDLGVAKINYKLRDWVFSRQRYWGEPIPVVHCEECGMVPVPFEQLPVMLPEVESYEPTDNGESPLAAITDWVNTTCPNCNKPAKRETDTMPQWAGSSWYFLRYTDPTNTEAFASKEALEYWLPVDWYNGGMEHTTLHLLYSRFWHKFLYDCGAVPTVEPYTKRTSHGMIMGENNEKMSKSRGNVINPDEIIEEFGADTLRTYEMFIGDFEKSVSWSMNGVKGCRRFLDRVWKLQEILVDGTEYSKELNTPLHKTIKKVSEDFERMKFNTAIAAMMAFLNDVTKVGKINKAELKSFLHILNPVAPHITEEIWEQVGYEKVIHETAWPVYDEAALEESVVEIAVQINGKLRTVINMASDVSREEAEKIALSDEKIIQSTQDKKIVKVIVIPGKIVNIVVK
ncbi:MULTISPECIES: leucine--tRNA ligase [unclassified Fusibacter]|uniref:leucine--tRNA ligase n=1 Tax=unclassified Fusibacter TaxID=2624464 RepID=UPI001010FE21|nr:MULTISPECIES: leucine--tRNA ligase [unclassified Fusibacter]MCK8060687.1 leucine--tRNA ligase [Fusibacter sp. A2]NPE22859.1 leucine--tRNA ligase [Fusibacter sp. A1]RXV59928.1 leucine--tRNA ligase [Fusibacter sp. A1]